MDTHDAIDRRDTLVVSIQWRDTPGKTGKKDSHGGINIVDRYS